MPDILSSADVFGPEVSGPPSSPSRVTPTPSAPSTAASDTLSHDDVFGEGAHKAITGKALPKAPPARQPRSDASIALGGVKAATKATARTVADFGDMLLSVPGMVMGTAADVASRVQSLAEGVDPKTGGRIAKQVREGVTSEFSPSVLRDLTEKVIQAVAPDKKQLSKTDVTKGMDVLSKGLEQGGKAVERMTGGLITAETFDSLVNEGRGLGGVMGAGALA